MKAIFCTLSLAVCLVMSQANAADSSINITGNVVDNTCEISTESQNFSVDLQTQASKQFSAQGSVSEMVPFSVMFVNCGSAATGIKLGFQGVTVTPESPLLKNDDISGAATGVAIQLLDAAREVIHVNTDHENLSWNRLESGSNNTLHFYARMIALTYPVTAGKVSATATMTIEFQ